MEYLVIAEIEIDGNRVAHYTNITLRQKFNTHHEFIIRISHDVLETSGSFSLENAQKKIGKPALIRFQKMELSLEVAYEFRGIICEVRMEQNGKSDADLVLIGYSPTILLENGQHLSSFFKKDLHQIVQQVTKPLDQVNCKININNHYSNQITYICQYRESSFHFLNRLSGEYSEFFYYDGKYLNFGKPATIPAIDITYGEDISSMQMTLQVQPMNFSNYAYLSKEDKLEHFDAPANVNGMGQYASYVLNESNNLFTEPVNLPIRQRVENRSDLENFVKNQKAARAANLEVLTGTCYNPGVSIGSQINVKVSKLEDQNFVKEDYGKFLVIGIEHHLNENGKYYNTFEAVPASTEVLPVNNIIMPVAEPQIAIVKKNNDPDNMGRVMVQMLWQKGNEMTDWIRVMTPDAGGGRDGARNRGLVVIPEVGDQVLICFHYNDADKPFVMGSLFHGHSGGGGGDNNFNKTLIALSGALMGMFGLAVHMIDAVGNFIKLDGSGNINLESTATITLKVGTSEIIIEPSKITIKANEVKVDSQIADIQGTTKAVLKKDDATYFKAEGAAAEVKSTNSLVEGTASAKLKGLQVEVNATGITTVKGASVTING